MTQFYELGDEKANLGPQGPLLGGDRQLVRAGLILLAVLTVWKLYIALITNVLWDEAHFAMSGQYLDLGYPDIPAGYPWLARLISIVGGWNILPLRIVALVIATLIPFAVYFMARPVAGRRNAIWAAILALLCPAVTNNGPIFYPEGGLQLLLALMAGCLLHAIRSDKMKWWIAAGVFAGLGLLVHFRFAIAGVAVLLFLVASPVGRTLWRRPGLYVTAGLALVGLLPAIVYNLMNDWPAVKFHIINRPRFEFHPAFVISFFTTQIGVANPVLFVAMAFGVKKALWDDRTRPGSLLGYLGVGIFLFYCLQALVNKRIMPHWSWMAYVPLLAYAPSVLTDFVDSARTAVARWGRMAVVAIIPVITLAFGVVASLMMYLNANAQQMPYSLRSFNTARSENWRLILPALTDVQARAKERFGDRFTTVTNGHATAVQIEFASKSGVRLYTLDDPDDQRSRFVQARQKWSLSRDSLLTGQAGQGVVLVLNEPEFVYHDADEVAFYKEICRLFEDVERYKAVTLPPERVAVGLYTARVRKEPAAASGPCPLLPSLYIARPLRGATLKASDGGQYFGTAVDPLGITRVDVLVDGKVVTETRYGLDPEGARMPDLLAFDPNYPKVQFDFKFPTGSLHPGAHTLSIRATRTDGTTVDSDPRALFVK